MFKISKKSIYSLGALAILSIAIFGVALMPTQTKADYNYYATTGSTGGSNFVSYPGNNNSGVNYGNYPSYYSPNYYPPTYQQPTVYIQANPEPVVVPVNTTQTITSESANPNPKTSTPNTVAKARSSTPRNSAVAYYIAVPAGTKVVNNLPSGATVANSGTTSDQLTGLTANAIFGDKGFMPNGIIQWIILAILILIVIILVRKLSGAEKNYHATPLKHD